MSTHVFRKNDTVFWQEEEGNVESGPTGKIYFTSGKIIRVDGLSAFILDEAGDRRKIGLRCLVPEEEFLRSEGFEEDPTHGSETPDRDDPEMELADPDL